MALTLTQPKIQALKIMAISGSLCEGREEGERQEYNNFSNISWGISSN